VSEYKAVTDNNNDDTTIYKAP